MGTSRECRTPAYHMDTLIQSPTKEDAWAGSHTAAGVVVINAHGVGVIGVHTQM